MTFKAIVDEHISCIKSLASIEADIVRAGNLLSETIRAGRTIFICGNGGSAADAQHFAAELVGRFERERKALPALALTTDTSIITALSNDYSYDAIFARQVWALGRPGDLLLGISTSGHSENVLLAMEAAGKTGLKTIGLLGRDGGKIKQKADEAVIVPHHITARIQEAHILILHFWAHLIEAGV
jgi:D-sedoheptulose 7-phosphate isomerase